MELKLNLNVQQINTILRCLGKHPFEEAAGLINEIQKQCQPQVAEQEEAAKVDTETTEETAATESA